MKKMTDDEYEKLLRGCTEAWGEDSQILIAIEEMGELIQVLSKYLWRDKGDAEKRAELLEKICQEIADVKITSGDQLRLIFGPDEVDKYKAEKTERLAGRLEKWQKENPR